jgi:prophage antirepressor-like protein
METTERSFTVVQEFQFKDSQQPVRAMLSAEGKPWFVANDVCAILEIANSRDAVSRLNDNEKGVGKADTFTGEKEVNIINLSGLFKLIFRSNKPQAETFCTWVTEDVLPSIQRTGFYGIPLNLEIPEDSAEAIDLWVYLGKHKLALLDRLRTVRDLEKKVMVKVKLSARPYHLPLDKQIGLFTEVQS